MNKNAFPLAFLVSLSPFLVQANDPVKHTQNMNKECIGKHLIVEFWDCKTIESETEIESLLSQAALYANSTLLNISTKKFEPQGVTSLALLAESHISIHTWPEKNYVALDVFTCGAHTTPYKAINFLREAFNPKNVSIKEVQRGTSNPKPDQFRTFERDTNLRLDDTKEFGYELVLNLYDCNPETIRSGKELIRFTIELCDLIDMKRFWEPFLERFALDSECAAGYSIAQMIETSLISGHFCEYWNSAYINIFSCKPYDAEVAIEFAKKFFGAERVTTKLLIR